MIGQIQLLKHQYFPINFVFISLLDTPPPPFYTITKSNIEGVHCHEQTTCCLLLSQRRYRKGCWKAGHAIGADIFEIQPEIPYTKADLNWMDKKSRSTIEMSDPTSRPAIAAKRDNMDEYDTIFVGFPIWWYIAPTIINTFLESYDLKGKTIIPFATSGGSDMGKTNEKLAPSCPGAKLLHGKVFNSYSSKADLSAWVETLSL